MKSKALSLLITAILAFAIISNISVGSVYATGGLDDEEEEQAIEELQDNVEEIKDDIDGLTLNLEEGLNDVTAICPTLTPPPQEEQPEQNETEPEGCQPIQEEEPEPPQTVIPPVTAEPEPEPGCNPIAEEPVENETSDLEPIICPINGELLGYLNTTSGEQLPISAGNQTEQVEEEPQTGGFLPPIDVPSQETEEPAEQETVAPEVETQECNNTGGVEEPAPTAEEPQVQFNEGCGCFEQTVPALEGGQ